MKRYYLCQVSMALSIENDLPRQLVKWPILPVGWDRYIYPYIEIEPSKTYYCAKGNEFLPHNSQTRYMGHTLVSKCRHPLPVKTEQMVGIVFVACVKCELTVPQNKFVIHKFVVLIHIKRRQVLSVSITLKVVIFILFVKIESESQRSGWLDLFADQCIRHLRYLS